MSATEAVPVEVPDIGDFEDVPVIEILVSAGDTVETDDPLLTLESDKATMDVPAPFAGTIKDIQVSVGDRVSQGRVLLTMEQAGSTAGECEGCRAASGGLSPAEQRPPPPDESNGAVYASPAVRRIARERGVDLHEVHGSGRKGRITREDVEQFESKGPAAAPASPGAPDVGLDLAPERKIDFSKFGPVERVQRSRIQRISAPH